MKDSQIAEIIDYLESGDKFSELLLKELKKPNLEECERKTYTSLLEALLGATELYSLLDFDEDEGNVIHFEETTVEEAREELEGWAIDFISETYQSENEDIKSGVNFRFIELPDGETRIFKNLLVKTDGTIHISNWY